MLLEPVQVLLVHVLEIREAYLGVCRLGSGLDASESSFWLYIDEHPELGGVPVHRKDGIEPGKVFGR